MWRKRTPATPKTGLIYSFANHQPCRSNHCLRITAHSRYEYRVESMSRLFIQPQRASRSTHLPLDQKDAHTQRVCTGLNITPIELHVASGATSRLITPQARNLTLGLCIIVDPLDSHIVGIRCLKARPKALVLSLCVKTWDVHCLRSLLSLTTFAYRIAVVSCTVHDTTDYRVAR